MTKEIKFYSTKEVPYGVFSNFARFSVVVDSKKYATTEHYYQAMKFQDEELHEKVRKCKNPKDAAEMGRQSDLPIRPDWESIKYSIMMKALRAKFSQYQSLRDLLAETGDAIIIEDSPTDYVWGCGADGTGKNLLGKALMEVRSEILQLKSALQECEKWKLTPEELADYE